MNFFVENNNFTSSFLCANDFENGIRMAREIYSWFLRSNTARGSSTCPVTIKASKSLLFTKDPSVDKRKNSLLTEFKHKINKLLQNNLVYLLGSEYRT